MPSDEGSLYLQLFGFVFLIVNLIFDWIVYDHVSKIAATLVHGNQWNGSADIHSLQEVHGIHLDWEAIRDVCLTFAILTSIVFTLQIIETVLRMRTNEKKAHIQLVLVIINIVVNDLPQCDSSSLTNEKDHHYFLNSADVCW